MLSISPQDNGGISNLELDVQVQISGIVYDMNKKIREVYRKIGEKDKIISELQEKMKEYEKKTEELQKNLELSNAKIAVLDEQIFSGLSFSESKLFEISDKIKQMEDDLLEKEYGLKLQNIEDIVVAQEFKHMIYDKKLEDLSKFQGSFKK